MLQENVISRLEGILYLTKEGEGFTVDEIKKWWPSWEPLPESSDLSYYLGKRSVSGMGHSPTVVVSERDGVKRYAFTNHRRDQVGRRLSHETACF